MIQYIYFVKCPDCDDEHFDAFEDAKTCAMNCLSKKPVITQVEVCRNDFGECTDSTDLGTVWSWEDLMTDISADSDTVFSKAETLGDDADYFNEFDEFSTLDNVPDNYAGPAVNTASAERKPVPADMTVKDLVEAMEENEDTVECVACEELYNKADCIYDENHGWICSDCQDNVVECTWCNELYDRGECRYEVNLEWLCSSCEAAIKSRGETLTFKEGSYWDFLDEDMELTEAKYPKLATSPTAREDIFNILANNPDQYIAKRGIDQTISGTPFYENPMPGRSARQIGVLRDFIIQEDGTIEIAYEEYGRMKYQTIEDTLKRVNKSMLKGSIGTHLVLKAIQAAAAELNRRTNITRARDNRVFNALNDEVAAKFSGLITKIEYAIPLTYYTEADVDKAEEPLTPEALKVLTKITSDFENFEFYKDLVDNGMVRDRLASEGYSYQISSSWGPACKITFIDHIENLPPDVLAVIRAAKGLGENEAIPSSGKSIDCYRLANMLIRYYRDALFFTRTPAADTENLTESLVEVLEEADDYHARLTTCNECGEKTLDESAGLCINCGAYGNKKTLAEEHTPFEKSASLSYYFNDEDAAELEKLITKAVETCKAEKDYSAVAIEIPYGHLRARRVRDYICKAMEEEGFPGASIVSYDDGIVIVPVSAAGMDMAAKLERMYGNAVWDNPISRGQRAAHLDQAITQPNMQPKNNPHAAGRQLAHNYQAITKSGSAIDYGNGSLIEPKQLF